MARRSAAGEWVQVSNASWVSSTPRRAGGIGEGPDQARFTHPFLTAIDTGDVATVDIDSHTKKAGQKDIRASMGELPVL